MSAAVKEDSRRMKDDSRRMKEDSRRVKDDSRTKRADPSVRADAEAILARIHTLRRGLLRHNPYADAERAGLTGPQVAVMTALVAKGAMTLTGLSQAVRLSHSTASGIVDRLESRGLVARTPDETDRRRTTITVTENVRRYVRQLDEGPAGRLASSLARATPADRRAIRRGLELLCELLQLPHE
jgi:DNA-binding MarR family transcriptional regulator